MKKPAPKKSDPIQLLIVDDHPVVRQGLQQLIDREPDMEVCAEADSAPAAIAALESKPCDMAIVDISLEGSNGIELIKNLRAQRRDFPILVLSMHDESLYAERALKAGARGYVMKHEATAKLITAIRHVMTGEIYVSEKMQTRILHQFIHGKTAPDQSPIDRLTDRELEVLTLLGHGKGTRQIAEELHLSRKTIESHRAHIKEKLSLSGAPDLMRFAVEWVSAQEPA